MMDKHANMMCCCCGGDGLFQQGLCEFSGTCSFSASVSQMSTVRKSNVMLLGDCNAITEWQTAMEDMQ